MKKIIIILVFSFSLASCEYWYPDDTYHQFADVTNTFFEINVGNNSVRGNNIVETSLGEFDEDQSAAFKVQAQHYNISELERNQDTGEIIYRYQPSHGYVGEDYVEIFAPTDRNGNEVFESNVLKFMIYVGQ